MVNISDISIFLPREGNTGKIKANVSFTVDKTLWVKGRIVEGSKGMFLALPQTPWEKDGKKEYKDEAGFTSKETAKAVNDLILEAYRNKVKNPTAPTKKMSGTPVKNSVPDEDEIPF